MILSVIYEDNHLLIVNKPAGYVTQGASSTLESLLAEAKDYLAEKYAKPGRVFLAAVSRLDRPVSGVVPFARTSKAAERLNAQFRTRTVSKIYWAIVEGDIPATGTLKHFLVRIERSSKSQAIRTPLEGSYPCELRYRVCQSWSRFHWIEIHLLTGGKHQIRAQFEALKCPIVGDAKYGSPTLFDQGIALHCRRLQFRHPTKAATLDIEAALPRVWRSLIGFTELAHSDAWQSSIKWES